MLAVVEHDQNVLRGKGIEQDLQNGSSRLDGYPQRLADGRRHRVFVRDGSELDQPDPVAGPIQQLGGGLQAQPGLARASGPGQGD